MRLSPREDGGATLDGIGDMLLHLLNGPFVDKWA